MRGGGIIKEGKGGKKREMNLNYLVCRHYILAFTIVRWYFIEAIFLPYNTAISWHLCNSPLHVSFGLELLLSVVSIYVHTYIYTDIIHTH